MELEFPPIMECPFPISLKEAEKVGKKVSLFLGGLCIFKFHSKKDLPASRISDKMGKYEKRFFPEAYENHLCLVDYLAI